MAGLMDQASSTRPPLDPVWLQRSVILWTVFKQRVEPLVRVLYRSQIDELSAHTQTMMLQPRPRGTEYALVLTIFYATANSLTDDECRSMFNLPQSTLLAECQALCEEALLQTNLFCMDDLATIKAVIFYFVSIPPQIN